MNTSSSSTRQEEREPRTYWHQVVAFVGVYLIAFVFTSVSDGFAPFSWVLLGVGVVGCVLGFRVRNEERARGQEDEVRSR